MLVWASAFLFDVSPFCDIFLSSTSRSTTVTLRFLTNETDDQQTPQQVLVIHTKQAKLSNTQVPLTRGLCCACPELWDDTYLCTKSFRGSWTTGRDGEAVPSSLLLTVRSIQQHSRSIFPTLQYPSFTARLLCHLYHSMLVISDDAFPECFDLGCSSDSMPVFVKSILHSNLLKKLDRHTNVSAGGLRATFVRISAK